MRNFVSVLAALLVIVLGVDGCGRPAYIDTVQIDSALISTEETTSSSAVWVFRHALVLDVPGKNLSLPFTGMMRLDCDKKTADVIGLSGMGLTFFDMAVAVDTFTTRFLHPVVLRLPDAVHSVKR
ncbi:hypothetical protein FACS1894168_1070 [Deltaproteobacteria bacterium]|nr:hypothetical protein FACS1894168_1070 [Deltaproteobacteria bacterium]